jgi:hypothetical protein
MPASVKDEEVVAPAKREEPKPVPMDEEDDDWSAVPAFLRRNKK